MTDPSDRILDLVRQSVGADLMVGAIAYFRRAEMPAGEKIEIGDVAIEAPWAACLVFVDLEPGVNWGHECRYLAVRVDGDEVLSVPARMPPFLKAGSMEFELLWCGPRAPRWAVATDQE